MHYGHPSSAGIEIDDHGEWQFKPLWYIQSTQLTLCASKIGHRMNDLSQNFSKLVSPKWEMGIYIIPVSIIQHLKPSNVIWTYYSVQRGWIRFYRARRAGPRAWIYFDPPTVCTKITYRWCQIFQYQIPLNTTIGSCDLKSFISFCINSDAAILVSDLSMVHILISTDVNVCIKIDYISCSQCVGINHKSEAIYLITWSVFARIFSLTSCWWVT